MPKFEIEYKESLKEVLKNMGVNLSFKPSIDFSNIRNKDDLMIDDVIHKTFLNLMMKVLRLQQLLLLKWLKWPWRLYNMKKLII